MQDNSNNLKYTKLSPADIEFFENINAQVTSSNALPFELPVDAFFRLTVQGLKFFWHWYEGATQEHTLFIPKSEIQKAPRVGANINLKLPNGIEGVMDWKAAQSNSYGSRMNDMLRIGLLNSYGSSGSSGGPITSTDAVVAMYEVQQYREMFTRGIKANYNKNTQIFKLQTNIPEGLVIDAFVRLFPEELYGDYMFERYIVALVESQLGRILTTFDFKLPGNVQLNYDEIQSNGREVKREIEEEIKASNNSDIMLGK
jgi:hypothetical protein